MIETLTRDRTEQGASRAPTPVYWQRFLGKRRSSFMSSEDRSYFEQRAEAEIARAQDASHPKAARAHYLLAGYYLDLVHCGVSDGDGVGARRHEDSEAGDRRDALIERIRSALGRLPEDWDSPPPELLRILA